MILANSVARPEPGPETDEIGSAAWTRLTGQSEEQLVITLNETELEAQTKQPCGPPR